MRNDENPMRKTQAYSFVDPPHSNVARQDELLPIDNLTIKHVITLIIEKNLQAWKALPDSIRTALMDRPGDFQLLPNKYTKDGNFEYNILYNGTIWKYNGLHLSWVIDSIV